MIAAARRMRSLAGLVLTAALLSAACAPEPDVAADMVLRGGKVVTVDEALPEAEAIAIKDGLILAVGTDDEIAAFVGRNTEVIALNGMLAVPGLIEAHAHFMGTGESKTQLNLMDVANWDEIVAMVQAVVADAAPGELIRGRGWHQEKWDRVPENAVEGFPSHHSLSAVSPDNPVILTHASGHASFANAKAMELAAVTRDTPDPPGGEILHSADGEPIGVFRETASGLLGPARENAARPEPRRIAQLAADEVLSKGITTFHDAGAGFSTIDLYKQMVDDGVMGVRLWVMVGGSNEELEQRLQEYRLIGYGDNRLTVRAIKQFMDGALGPRGAWLLEPYADLPGSVGLNTTPPEYIAETARIAFAHDFQLAVHAIGDRANREVLNIYERTFRTDPGKTDLRWRIEHAQHIDPADIPRFGQLGVIAAMQGIHCTSDAVYVLQRLGQMRAEAGAYVWRKLYDTGATIANGTDAPVEDVDPIASYYASVSRRLNDGSVFFPEQRMTRMEALRSYTIDAAYAGFEEDIKGSLTPGKLADITVLSRDILAIPEEEIPGTEVAYTIVGGKVMFSRGSM